MATGSEISVVVHVLEARIARPWFCQYSPSGSPTVRQPIERDVILFPRDLGLAPALAALVPRQEYLNRPPDGAPGCLRLHRVHYAQ